MKNGKGILRRENRTDIITFENEQERKSYMVFSSMDFVFHFLPVFLAVYFLTPFPWKNWILFLGSLCFYLYGTQGHLLYIVLLLSAAAVAYLAGRSLEKSRSRHGKRLCLLTGLGYSLGMLIVFKYSGFIVENVNMLLNMAGMSAQLPSVEPALPLGISFYTFQVCSYLIDVYRGTIQAERSLFRLMGYVCMFPQLLSGPLIRYGKLMREWKDRVHSMDGLEEGLRIFTAGLGMKVLIANQVGNLWRQTWTIGFESISTPMAWLGLLAYTLQIYFDFYGYSLMASGLGRVMGFHFPDNFRQPYLSVSMTEFWRRWHITLGEWFRDYVYIPLGGSRTGMGRTLRNLLAVWLLTGLWHGASWNYILWGIVLFLIIAVEKLGFLQFLERHRIFGHLYMTFWIPISWLVFAVEDLPMVWIYLTRLFPFLGGASASVFSGDYLKYGKAYGISLALGLACIGGLPEKLWSKKHGFLTAAVLLAVFWCSIYCIWKGMDDPFLYFSF